jgi:hypothetical protein
MPPKASNAVPNGYNETADQPDTITHPLARCEQVTVPLTKPPNQTTQNETVTIQKHQNTTWV